MPALSSDIMSGSEASALIVFFPLIATLKISPAFTFSGQPGLKYDVLRRAHDLDPYLS